MGFDVIRPAFNPEPKYRVTVLTIVKWTRGPGTPVVKGFVWITAGSGTTKGTGAGVCGKKAQYLSRKVFKAEVNAILACVYEIQTNVRP